MFFRMAIGLLAVSATGIASVAAQPSDHVAWESEELLATELLAELPVEPMPAVNPHADAHVEPAGWCPSAFKPSSNGKAYPTVALSGFFQADAIWFAQDDANTAAVGDAQDVADFRRARLAAKGKVAENVDYLMEYDFAFPGRPSFMDVYLDLADVSRLGRLRVGQWRQPLGMDALTSVRDLVLIERALPFALVPFRQIGVGLYDTAADERVTWAVSAYRFPSDVYGEVAGDAGYGFSTRETVLLYAGQATSLHLGGGYTYNRPSTSTARLRSSPEVGFNQLDIRSTDFPVPFFVDTGSIATDSYQVANVELAGTRGPWLAQSEVYVARLDPTGGEGLTFHGAYAQVAYVLTDETHPYNRAAGVYGRLTPNANYGRCGMGAWELAGRWSYLDLSDGPVEGGVLEDLTFGLNWYLNKNTKFQFNYIHAFLERPTATDSNADVLAIRAQLDF